MDRKDYEDSLAQQSWLSEETVKAVVNAVDYKALHDAMPIKEIFDAQKIIITGMGDSYCAGIAVKPIFEKVAKVETEVWRAIEFSRIMSSKQLGFSPNTPMVIGISVSGNPARVQECLERANHYHANTILVTDQPSSPTAQVARHVVYAGLPEGTPYGPGANSYIGSLVSLALMAIRIGRAKGTINQNEWEDMNILPGLKPYDAYPTESEWIKQFEGYCGMGSPASDRYYSYLPVSAGGNVYCNGAKPWKKEEDAVQIKEPVELSLTEADGIWTLHTNLYDILPVPHCAMITTNVLGKAVMPEQQFEHPDGSPITFDTDYSGRKRKDSVLPGPFAVGSEKTVL